MPKENISYGSMQSGIYYTSALTEHMLSENKDSKIIETISSFDEEMQIGMNLTDMATQSFGIKYSFNYYYDDYLLMTLPEDAAIKTGTPQKTKEITSSAAICYYPADDPELAISCFLEEGEYSKYMLRQIIDAYYGYGIYAPDYVPPVLDENGNEVTTGESVVPEETTTEVEE